MAVSQVLEQGIGKGISAEALGRQVRKFLNNGGNDVQTLPYEEAHVGWYEEGCS